MDSTGTWPVGAESWVADVLAPRRVYATGLQEAPRSWVARVEDGSGVWYFKEDRSHGPAEAAVLERLTERRSPAIAVVAAVDVPKGWSLTCEAGQPLREADSTDIWELAVRRLGEAQLLEAAHVGDWRRLGCRDLSGDHLGHAIQDLLDAASSELEPDAVDALAAKTPRIEEACQTLMSDPVPDTIVHRDVVPENVAVSVAGPVLIDWSDVAVGHPFFACDRLLDFCWTDQPRKQSVIDAYLSAFHSVADLSTLRASFEAILQLRVLYEGIRWKDEIKDLDPASAHAMHLWGDALAGLRAMAAFNP